MGAVSNAIYSQSAEVGRKATKTIIITLDTVRKNVKVVTTQN